MNSIEKRKATILRKRENKLTKQQIYKKKQEKLTCMVMLLICHA